MFKSFKSFFAAFCWASFFDDPVAKYFLEVFNKKVGVFNLLNNYGESILKQTTAELYKLIRVENENI